MAKRESGLTKTAKFNVERVDEENVRLNYGAFNIGMVPNEKLDETKGLIINLLDEIVTWRQLDDMRCLYEEIREMKEALHEELIVVILRRVIPGRCKYCPI